MDKKTFSRVKTTSVVEGRCSYMTGLHSLPCSHSRGYNQCKEAIRMKSHVTTCNWAFHKYKTVPLTLGKDARGDKLQDAKR